MSVGLFLARPPACGINEAGLYRSSLHGCYPDIRGKFCTGSPGGDWRIVDGAGNGCSVSDPAADRVAARSRLLVSTSWQATGYSVRVVGGQVWHGRPFVARKSEA